MPVDPQTTIQSATNEVPAKPAAISQEHQTEPTGRCFMRSQDAPTDYGIRKCAEPEEGYSGLKFLVLGDSYVKGAYLTLRAGFKGTHIGHFAVPGCGLQTPETAAARARNHCSAHYQHFYDNVLPRLDLDGIILASDWLNVSDETLDAVLLHLEKAEIPAAIFGLRPKFLERVPAIVSGSASRQEAVERANQLLHGRSELHNRKMARTLGSNVRYIEVWKILCPNECLIYHNEDSLIYKDQSHLTVPGSVWLGRELRKSAPDLLVELAGRY